MFTRISVRIYVFYSLQGITDYRDCYRAWSVQTRRPNRAQWQTNYQPPTMPFEGESISKLHYRGLANPRVKSCRPDLQTGDAMKAPFDEDTVYRLDYTRKQIEVCPAALLGSRYSPYPNNEGVSEFSLSLTFNTEEGECKDNEFLSMEWSDFGAVSCHCRSSKYQLLADP
ncbi:unnamed protein product [Protopolystoma xenopodis]|uniref:Uncharacterized protein n=1 Tax=Protopolystoma xenopodis TaxID=117903 RepID=A0A448WI56_9PLAT|nr:unnamed protein product [Protopolystoma xenopodis]